MGNNTSALIKITKYKNDKILPKQKVIQDEINVNKRAERCDYY